MLKQAYQTLSKNDEKIPLRIKLEDAIFSSIKLRENEDPLASMHDAIAICGGNNLNIRGKNDESYLQYFYGPALGKNGTTNYDSCAIVHQWVHVYNMKCTPS